MISDGNSSLRSGDFVRVGDERTSPTSYARAFECVGLMIGFQCVDYIDRTDETGILTSLDQEKAFHRVNLTFLQNLLEKYGFGPDYKQYYSLS